MKKSNLILLAVAALIAGLGIFFFSKVKQEAKIEVIDTTKVTIDSNKVQVDTVKVDTLGKCITK
jgi:hypothetical protein